MIRPRLKYLILFLSLGLVASYVSVNVLTSYSYLPSGIAISNYGFPLPWETVTVSGTLCGQSPSQPHDAYSLLNGTCLASCCFTTYNLAFLLFDVLFYMGIVYLSLLSYHRLMRGIDRRASELVRESKEPMSVEEDDQSQDGLEEKVYIGQNPSNFSFSAN